MGVRRTLPQRARSLIGAWCFLDHYGPERTRMDVPPHPHTGLQTVSWLFEGVIEHRDSVGSHAFVRPGELNLMTAGAGIAHSEISVATDVLHGAQLWVALPETARHRAPSFERFLPTPIQVGPAVVRVFLGRARRRALDRPDVHPAARRADRPAGRRHGAARGRYRRSSTACSWMRARCGSSGEPVPVSHLAYLAPGRQTIEIAADTDARLLLLGGEPFPEHIVMWWNFIGRDHDEIVAFREQWQASDRRRERGWPVRHRRRRARAAAGARAPERAAQAPGVADLVRVGCRGRIKANREERMESFAEAPDRVVAVGEAIARDYAANLRQPLHIRRAIIDEIAQLQPMTPIVDVGCGDGDGTILLADVLGSDVVGVDPVPAMIERARAAHPDLRFGLGDFEHLPLESGTVGLVTALNSWHLVPDRRLAFREVRRVLAPGGLFAIAGAMRDDASAFARSSASIFAETSRSRRSMRTIERITNQNSRPIATVGTSERIAFGQNSVGMDQAYVGPYTSTHVPDYPTTARPSSPSISAATAAPKRRVRRSAASPVASCS